MKYQPLLAAAGLGSQQLAATGLPVHTPIDGTLLGKVTADSPAAVEEKVQRAVRAFEQWRQVPAPARGDL
ncbi:MAG TPA: aldehyde dehydrogenase family protein, partial [Steroidobacteraceae bacterium]